MASQLASIQFEEDEDLNIETEEVSEQDREFIKLIIANNILWRKDSKDYKNANLRMLTWETVGQSLPQPMSGKFWSLK